MQIYKSSARWPLQVRQYSSDSRIGLLSLCFIISYCLIVCKSATVVILLQARLMELDALIDQWKQSSDGTSESSKGQYRYNLRRFQRERMRRRAISTATGEDLRQHLESLDSSVKRRTSTAMRGFFSFLHHENIIESNPARALTPLADEPVSLMAVLEAQGIDKKIIAQLTFLDWLSVVRETNVPTLKIGRRKIVISSRIWKSVARDFAKKLAAVKNPNDVVAALDAPLIVVKTAIQRRRNK